MGRIADISDVVEKRLFGVAGWAEHLVRDEVYGVDFCFKFVDPCGWRGGVGVGWGHIPNV